MIRGRQRTGAATVVCVLACLLVACALLRTMTQSTLRIRRQASNQHQLRQTELLLDAGILRSAQQLRRNADYPGEIWQPTSKLGRFQNPQVEIVIRREPGNEANHWIAVTATLGSESERADAGSDPRPPSTSTQTRRSYEYQTKVSNTSTTE